MLPLISWIQLACGFHRSFQRWTTRDQPCRSPFIQWLRRRGEETYHREGQPTPQTHRNPIVIHANWKDVEISRSSNLSCQYNVICKWILCHGCLILVFCGIWMYLIISYLLSFYDFRQRYDVLTMFCSPVAFFQDVLFVDQWKCPQCQARSWKSQGSSLGSSDSSLVSLSSRYLTCSPNSQAARDFKNALLWLSSIGNVTLKIP